MSSGDNISVVVLAFGTTPFSCTCPGSGSQSAPLNKGVYLARCSATVTCDYSVTASFPDQVTVTRPANMDSTAGIAIAPLQIQASDNLGGQTFTYAATGLPAGLQVNAATGQITGTPTTPGTYDVTVTATDTTTAASDSTEFGWLVS